MRLILAYYDLGIVGGTARLQPREPTLPDMGLVRGSRFQHFVLLLSLSLMFSWVLRFVSANISLSQTSTILLLEIGN